MIFAKVEDGDDIGMKAPPRRSRLTAEALQPLIGAATRRQIGSHDFYCHHPVDDGIVGAINFAHCAGAEQSLDAVTADAVDRLHGPSLAASSIGRYAIHDNLKWKYAAHLASESIVPPEFSALLVQHLHRVLQAAPHAVERHGQ